MGKTIRILLLADSHLGFDLPTRPRVRRRRRGHDFLANYERALAPALDGRVDLVVHGGDVFHRARVASSIAYQAFEPLVRVANRGIPVFIVPGNHERSRLPHARFAGHCGIHVFDRPRTFTVNVGGIDVALSGFPFERNVRPRFRDLLAATGAVSSRASIRLLCVHHCVEGATVGPGNFTFTTSSDVIRTRELPAVAAVLSGHIHRHQVLTKDLEGQPLAAPVLYPGSIERTSLAEKDEAKGYMILRVPPDATRSPSVPFAHRTGAGIDWEFKRLPARPMIVRELRLGFESAPVLEARFRSIVASVPADAVLRVRLTGPVTHAARTVLASRNLRTLTPETMNVELRMIDDSGSSPFGSRPRVPVAEAGRSAAQTGRTGSVGRTGGTGRTGRTVSSGRGRSYARVRETAALDAALELPFPPSG